jgi:hypothetical protein
MRATTFPTSDSPGTTLLMGLALVVAVVAYLGMLAGLALARGLGLR